MSPGTIVDRIDEVQRRHRPLAFLVGVGKRFGEDGAGRLAALIAYYGFFSVFPLLLVLVTLAGFVLDDRPDLREDLIDSAVDQIPVVGEQLLAGGLSGSGLALAAGIAGALWAGLGAVLAAQHAMNEVWDVPRPGRPNFVKARLRATGILAVIGIGLVGATVATSVPRGLVDGLPLIADVGILAGAWLVNFLALWVTFQLLTAPYVSWRELVPGAVLGGLLFALLQQLGGWIVQRYLAGASDTYGTFAIVIGLLSWFHLLAQAALLSAEVNVVLARKLYPRSLRGDLTDADERALEGQMRAAQRDERLSLSDVAATSPS